MKRMAMFVTVFVALAISLQPIVLAEAIDEVVVLDARVDFGADRPESGFFLGFGKRIAGVYLGEVFIEGGPVLIRMALQINDDGTFGGFDDTDASVPTNSPGFGTWTRSGPREAALRGLTFVYDVNGALTDVIRVSGVIEFGPGYRTISGTFGQEVFAPDQLFDPPRPNTEEPPDFGAYPGFPLRGVRLETGN